MNMADLNQQALGAPERVQDLLARVPQSQRQAAAALLAQYGPRFFDIAQEDAWQYLRRLLAGDLDGDNVINSLDFSNMNTKWYTNDPVADLNRDGLVNALDFSLLNKNWQRAGD